MDELITDITLDHLPDLSDASVSFQIPPNTTATDLLLADHTGGFDLLCNADDDDASFAPLRVPRGQLGDLTPRVLPTSCPPPHTRSPTPTSASSVILPSLTLGHTSPGKSSHISSSIHRLLQSPLVSEERLDQLRADVVTLGHAESEPTHVRAHVMQPPQHGVLDCPPPSHSNSEFGNDTVDSPPSEDPQPEENDTHHDTQPQSDQDVVMPTREDGPADATVIAAPRPRPKSGRNPRTTAKPTVAAGGISKRPFPTTRISKKTKSKPSRVQEAHNVPPNAPRHPTPPQPVATDTLHELGPPAWSSGDTDIKSGNTQITHPGTGGVAERLVSYSQRLISSIGLYKPWSEGSSSEAPNDAVTVADAPAQTRTPAAVLAPSPPPPRTNDAASARHEPLRLSEISPRKLPASAPQPNSPALSGTVQQGRRDAVSPMRPAKKRVSMDADLPPECHRRKKGKVTLANADSERGSSDEAGSQDPLATGEAQTVTHPAAHDRTRHPDSLSNLPSARTKYKPQFSFSSECKGPTLDAFPYLSSSRRVRETIDRSKNKCDEAPSKRSSVLSDCSASRRSTSSLLRRDKRTRYGHAVRSSLQRKHSGPSSAGNLPLAEKKQNQNATLSLTKPVGFTFRVDARLEARRTEARLAASEPGVPGCKARLTSHQSAIVFQKEVVPSAPAPFYFYTEQRAKEREEFDVMVKHKEEEMEKLREEERRREAEEDAVEIRELRRKAVPKANAVPEWYADMPKKKAAV